MDPDGAQLYAVARDDESIVIFNRDNDELSGQFGRLLSGGFAAHPIAQRCRFWPVLARC